METTNKISLTKKILIALGGILSCACVGFGFFHSVQNFSIVVHAENEVHRKKYNQKAIYDDVQYKISLSLEDLSFEYTNLNTYLYTNLEADSNVFSGTTITYNSTTYLFDDIWLEQGNCFIAYADSDYIKFENGYFKHLVTDVQTEDTVQVDFLYGITWNLNSTTYSFVKTNIDLDIHVNSEVPTPSYVLYPINANNDTFTYLGQQIVTNISTIATTLANSYVVYRGVTYNFLNASNGSLTWQDSVSKDSINFGFQTHNDYPVNKFFYFNFTDTEVENFEDIVYFYDAEFIADNITAPMNTGNFITDLIALLTGGITGTSTAMGVGLSSLVDALAIQNNAMSPFMSVIFAFGGIALALALCRWIVNLLSSLGQRNR